MLTLLARLRERGGSRLLIANGLSAAASELFQDGLCHLRCQGLHLLRRQLGRLIRVFRIGWGVVLGRLVPGRLVLGGFVPTPVSVLFGHHPLAAPYLARSEHEENYG